VGRIGASPIRPAPLSRHRLNASASRFHAARHSNDIVATRAALKRWAAERIVCAWRLQRSGPVWPQLKELHDA